MPFKQQQRDKAKSPEPVTDDVMVPAPRGFHPEFLGREPGSRPCMLTLAGQALWIVCIARVFRVGNRPAGLLWLWSVVGDKETAVYQVCCGGVFPSTTGVSGSPRRCVKPRVPPPFASPESGGFEPFSQYSDLT